MKRPLRKKPQTDLPPQNSKPWSVETGMFFSCSDFTALNHAQQAMYVRRLLKDWKIDSVKELVHNHERLRIAFYETSRVVVALLVGKGILTFSKVSIGEEHTQWTVQRSNYFQFTNHQQFTQIHLAGFVMEGILWTDNEVACTHAAQDFDHLYNRQLFEYVYDAWLNPIGFNEKWRLKASPVTPPLTKDEIMHKLQQIFIQEMQNVARLLKENRELYYTLACALHEKWSLTLQEVQSLLHL